MTIDPAVIGQRGWDGLQCRCLVSFYGQAFPHPIWEEGSHAQFGWKDSHAQFGQSFSHAYFGQNFSHNTWSECTHGPPLAESPFRTSRHWLLLEKIPKYSCPNAEIHLRYPTVHCATPALPPGYATQYAVSCPLAALHSPATACVMQCQNTPKFDCGRF